MFVDIPLTNYVLVAKFNKNQKYGTIKGINVYYRKKAHVALAITNRILDRENNIIGYAFFADYDNMDISQVISNLQEINNKINLGYCYILKSSKNSYHVISPFSYSFSEILDLMELAKTGNSRKMFAFKKEISLRITPKHNQKEDIELVNCIGFVSDRVISSPHFKYLCDRHGVKILSKNYRVGFEDKLEFKKYEYYNY